MPVIGITGGISTGKSTFCDCLRDLLPDAKCFNADHAARELVDLDPNTRKELEIEFGPSIFSAGGDLNRKQLRSIVFSSADKRRLLENILHPRIRRRWSAEAEPYRTSSSNFFFADIPLLFETGGETLCDCVVVVACAGAVQLHRLLRRAPIDPGEAEKIISAQMPLADKIARANHVVWNNADRNVLCDQAKLLIGLWRNTSWTKK